MKNSLLSKLSTLKSTAFFGKKHTLICKGFLTLLIMVLGMGVSWGQIYVNQFTGVSACPTNGNTPTMATNSTGAAVTRTTVTCNSTANVFNSTTLNNTSSISNTSYIEFSATANSGFILNLTSVSFLRQGSNSAPNQIEVRYSTDGFSTSTSWGSAPVTPTSGTTATWDFTDFSTGNAGTVTFRIYPYGTTKCDLTSNSSASGTFRVDSVTINGSVTSSATPSISLSSPSQIVAGNVNQGTTSHILSNFQAAVTVADASLNSIAVVTGGTYSTSSHVSNYKLMYNASSNTFGSATQIGTTQASVASLETVTFSSLSQSITSDNTGYFWVTADISSVATDSQTVNIAASPTLTFTSGSPTGSISAGGAQTFVAVTPNIAISSNHPVAANINQNTTNQVFGSIALAVTTANATLNSIVITTAGTYQTSDLLASSFKLYYTTSNTFATTTLLGSAQAIVASGNTITFSGLSQTINSGVTGYLWFTADVAYNAVNGSTLSTTSTAFSTITFASGTKTGINPVAAGNDQTITAVIPSIAIAQNGPTASNVNLSTTNAVLYGLSLAVTGNTTDFNSLTVTTGGTYQTSDFVASSFKLYYTTTNSFSSATPLSTSHAIVTSGNTITFSGINQNILVNTTGYLWVTVDISASAVAARTINITSTDFSNITFAAGNKTGTDPAIAGGVRTITAPPSLTEVVFPQYIQGVNGTNTNRIPFAYRATINNLTPNATYRYINGVELTSASVTSVGAGNCVFPDPIVSNAFVYSTGPSLSSVGNYGTFTTDNSGAYSGWFIIAPSGNATRFVPGTSLYARIGLNDGANGIISATVLSSTNTITVINLVNSAGSNNGTGLRGLSNAPGKNFVFAYDNTSGTGRPLSGTFVENDGAAETASFAPFYSTSVDGVSSAFGMVIPNNNSNGVKRFEFKNFSDNALQYAVTDSDGNWGGSANTVNPTGGTTELVIPQTFDDIIINSNVTLSAATSVFGTVTVQNSATLTTGGLLTLKSNASGTASIGVLTTGTITGNATVERYIPARRAWRALTAPLKGGTSAASIFSQWQNNGNNTDTTTGVELWGPDGTGSTGNGLAVGTNNSILKYVSGAWAPVTDTKNTNLFTADANNAFMVFPTGGYGSGLISSASNPVASDTTLKATGQLITGQVDFLSLPSASHTLIGNPYASAISPYSILTGNASFGSNLWIWDARAAGTYGVGAYNSYDKVANKYTNVTNYVEFGTTPDIQSGQAFFVIASSVPSTLTIFESFKSSSAANNIFLRNAAPAEVLRVGLYKQINNEWSGRDGAMTVFFSDAEANQVNNKMANGSENVAFTRNGTLFASEHHLPLVASDVLNVKVWNTTAGANYKLKINTEEFNTTNLDATLEDLFTNSRTPLTLDGTAIEYPFAVTTEAASTGNRFRIVFENSALGINNPKASGISILPNPITGDTFQVNLGTLSSGTYSYSICNALGQEVENGSINTVAQNTSCSVKFKNNTAAGIYIMKVTGTDNSVFTTKIIKK